MGWGEGQKRLLHCVGTTHFHIDSTVFCKNPKHDPISATTKKINSAKTRTTNKTRVLCFKLRVAVKESHFVWLWINWSNGKTKGTRTHQKIPNPTVTGVLGVFWSLLQSPSLFYTEIKEQFSGSVLHFSDNYSDFVPNSTEGLRIYSWKLMCSTRQSISRMIHPCMNYPR